MNAKQRSADDGRCGWAGKYLDLGLALTALFSITPKNSPGSFASAGSGGGRAADEAVLLDPEWIPYDV